MKQSFRITTLNCSLLCAASLFLGACSEREKPTVAVQTSEQIISALLKVAETGDANAQYKLSLIYTDGTTDVPKDNAKAIGWLEKAAAQGHADAQFNLGVMYNNGDGVPRDPVAAYMWASLAASRATGDTQQMSASARDALDNTMTPAQIAEAQKLAREWQAAFEKRVKK